MWTRTIPLRTLADAGRWKFEPPRHDGPRLDSVFPAVALGTLVRERRETLVPREFPDHRFHFVGLENVESMTGQLVDHAPRLGREVRSRSKVFRSGDVLYGRLRPALNKVLLVPEEMGEGICSGEFIVLAPDTAVIDAAFLHALLLSELVAARAAAMPTGSALPRLQAEDLLSIEVPLPPRSFQQRVARMTRRYHRRRRGQLARVALEPAAFLEKVARALREGDPGDTAPACPPAPPPLERLALPDGFEGRDLRVADRAHPP